MVQWRHPRPSVAQTVCSIDFDPPVCRLNGGRAVVGYLETGQQVLNRVKPHRRSAGFSSVYNLHTVNSCQNAVQMLSHGTVILDNNS